MKKLALAAIAVATVGCDSATPDLSQLNEQDRDQEVRPGFVGLMPSAEREQVRAIMPTTANEKLNYMLRSPDTIWYDEAGIVPGYQDSFGDPEGMRPNTIRKGLINLAVPGGHEKLFASKGRFHFPFGTGGMDDSTNGRSIKFWVPPKDASGQVLPVVYWRENFSRWRWVFPVDTVLGEVLLVKQPDGSEQAFEIRTRTRNLEGWTSDAFRPFTQANQLATAVKTARPNWRDEAQLVDLVSHLESSDNLESVTLQADTYASVFAPHTSKVDKLPSFGEPKLAQELLANSTFSSAKGKAWRQGPEGTALGYTTDDSFGLTANKYDGAAFEVSDDFCSKCHVDAGRMIGDFDDRLVAYGELWGEDRTFSWHLFDDRAFVDRSTGRVRNFNNDNRKVRPSFVAAGLVTGYKPSEHPESIYKRLPQNWSFRPF